jgi:hypothetical protein
MSRPAMGRQSREEVAAGEATELAGDEQSPKDESEEEEDVEGEGEGASSGSSEAAEAS